MKMRAHASPPSLAGGPFRGRDSIFGTYIAIDDQLFETGTRSYDFEILVRHIALHDGTHLYRMEELWLMTDQALAAV